MQKNSVLHTKHNMSQKALADDINVTQASISRWEADQMSISGRNLLKLAEYFNISVDKLLGHKVEE